MQPHVHRERVAACHSLLLRLAGTIPDDLTTQCRHWLGDGHAIKVGRSIAFAVVSQRLSLTDSEVDLLVELLSAAGIDSSELSIVDIIESEPTTRFAFVARRADVEHGSGRSAADRHPGKPVVDERPDDEVERSIVAGVQTERGARAVWRAWRLPSDSAPWPPPRRVYVVEIDRSSQPVAVAARLQTVAAGAGEVDPQIEVYFSRGVLPSYQRLARAFGALIWARDVGPVIRLATVPHPTHWSGRTVASLPRLGGPDAKRLVAYLRYGELLVSTATRMPDIVAPVKGSVVPMDFRTDGHWIWSDAVRYYLEEYGLAPEPELVDHVRRMGFVLPDVDGAAICRALLVLPEPLVAEAVWLYGF